MNRNHDLRIIAIGDIHGQAQLLGPLLQQIESDYMDSQTSVVFLGDYLNRSPSPEACRSTMKCLSEFVERYPTQTFLLRGNHEWNFLQTIDFDLDHLNMTKPWEFEIYKEYERLIRSTLMYYETDEYFFSHAGGVLPDRNFARHDIDVKERFALYWRYDLPDEHYDKTVVRAHEIVKPEDVFGENVISIDLGSYKTGKLGAVVLPERLLLISEQPS
jgi:serine/threonine protein phosphatase 1